MIARFSVHWRTKRGEAKAYSELNFGSNINVLVRDNGNGTFYPTSIVFVRSRGPHRGFVVLFTVCHQDSMVTQHPTHMRTLSLESQIGGGYPCSRSVIQGFSPVDTLPSDSAAEPITFSRSINNISTSELSAHKEESSSIKCNNMDTPC